MKWIGQHIWSFISRFRNDVYLENISEVTQDHVVSIDADGKLYKQDVAAGDITAVTITTDSGGGSAASDTSGSADFSLLGSEGVGITNSGTTITAVAVAGEINHNALSNYDARDHYRWSADNSGTATIHTNNITDLHGAGVDGSDNQLLTDGGDGSITSEANLTYDGTDLTAVSSSEGKPVLTLKTTHTTKTKSAELQFLKDAADTEDGENLGIITFYGENESNSNTKFGHIKGSIQESDAGAEGGNIKLAVATHDGEMVNGLVINDGNSEDEIDVTIGSTTTSVTTVAGTITMAPTGSIIRAGTPRIYETKIKLIPSDFMDNGDGGNTKFGVAYTDVAGTGYGMRPPNNATELYAFVSIPEGMKATHVDIFDKNDLAIEVFEAQINATTMTSKGSGNCNTTLDITDVNSSATNFLAIEVTTTSVNDRIYGGTVTIVAQ